MSSASDGWAVGVAGGNPLIEHWDGQAWTYERQLDIDGSYSAVLALSPTDAWALGQFYFSPQTLIQHWDGSSWTSVGAPGPGTKVNEFEAVTAVASDDIWAVGHSENPGDLSYLFFHWDGVAWTAFPPGFESDGGYLTGVSAIASDDVWAVGRKSTGVGYNTNPVGFHWDGMAWTEVPVELPSPGLNVFNAVVAVSPSAAWAVGSVSAGALIERWDGQTWTISSGSPQLDSLRGVAGASSTDVWAVGLSAPDEAGAEHWDGTTWRAVRVVRQGQNSVLEAVDVLTSHDVWAAGIYADPAGVPLFEHSKGACP
jgi:hypothetical protein